MLLSVVFAISNVRIAAAAEARLAVVINLGEDKEEVRKALLPC